MQPRTLQLGLFYMTLDLINNFSIFLLAGVIQCVVVALFLITKQNQAKYLGALWLVYAVVLLEIFLTESGLIMQTWYLRNIAEPPSFLIGPLVYFAVALGVGQPAKHKLVHLLPFFVMIVLHVTYLISGSQSIISSYIFTHLNSNDVGSFGFLAGLSSHALVTFLHLLFYLLLSAQRYRSQPVKVPWIEFLMVGSTICYLAFGVVIFLFNIAGSESYYGVFLTGFTYLFAFYLLKHSNDFELKVRYEGSPLNERMKEEIITDLSERMRSRKWYREQDLSLEKVATDMGLSKNYLSQAINEKLKMNFSQYLNDLRVDEAKQLLLREDLRHLKLSEIGHLAGYRSKSVFYSSFKQREKTTPSAFIKSSNL